MAKGVADKPQQTVSLAEFAKNRKASFGRCVLCNAPHDIQKQVSDAVKAGTVSRKAIVEWLKNIGHTTSPASVTNHVEHHSTA